MIEINEKQFKELETTGTVIINTNNETYLLLDGQVLRLSKTQEEAKKDLLG
jgi:hypothetical protein